MEQGQPEPIEGRTAMDEETIYTDEQIQLVAEKLAEGLRTDSPMIISYMIKWSEEYRRGPFGILSLRSSEYNPLGRFPVEPETLTSKQKAIITKIVGKAFSQKGVDYDEEKEKRAMQKFLKRNPQHSLRRVDRDWDLEQRLRNARNHEF